MIGGAADCLGNRARARVIRIGGQQVQQLLSFVGIRGIRFDERRPSVRWQLDGLPEQVLGSRPALSGGSQGGHGSSWTIALKSTISPKAERFNELRHRRFVVPTP